MVLNSPLRQGKAACFSRRKPASPLATTGRHSNTGIPSNAPPGSVREPEAKISGRRDRVRLPRTGHDPAKSRTSCAFRLLQPLLPRFFAPLPYISRHRVGNTGLLKTVLPVTSCSSSCFFSPGTVARQNCHSRTACIALYCAVRTTSAYDAFH